MDNLHTVSHAAMYGRASSPRGKDWEGWFYEQRLAYPNHPRHHQLIEAYEGAREAHAQAVKVVQFAIKYHLQNPDKLTDEKDAERNQEKVTLASQAMTLAERELREFNNHLPEQRIQLYQAEIDQLEPQLEEAKAEEHAFIQQLLNDPDAAKARLERQIRGGNSSEYSPDQLTELRRLRGVVESLQGKIKRCRWDIQSINELAAEEQKREQIQSEMNVLLPKFGKAAAKFTEALGELQSVAREHGVHLDTHGLKVPRGATFRLSSGVYDGPSTITLQWD